MRDIWCNPVLPWLVVFVGVNDQSQGTARVIEFRQSVTNIHTKEVSVFQYICHVAQRPSVHVYSS